MPTDAKTLARIDNAITRLEAVNVKLGGQPGSVSQLRHHDRADLEKVVARLETAANALEQSRSNRSRPSQESESGIIVQAYDQLLNGKLARFFQLSDEIGGDVANQVAMVKQAFHAESDFLVWVSNHPRQPQDVTVGKLKATLDTIQAIEDFRNKNRGSKLFNHLSSVSEGISALGWVIAAGKSCTFVKEKSDAAQFYTNRVLKDFRDKDPKHVDWVRGLIGGLKELEEYTRDHHPVTLTWGK